MAHNSETCTCRRCQRKAQYQPIEAAKEKRDAQEDIFAALSKFQSEPIHKHGGKVRRSRKRVGELRPGPTPEELHWRESVLVRDNYRCVFCGSTEDLEADHIKPKVLYPDLRLDISNGRTLCNPCHRQTPTYGWKARRLTEIDEESS